MTKKKQAEVLVQLDVLGARQGHQSETIQVNDDKPERRAELAKHLEKLIKGGFAVMLSDGTKVVGYDASSNSWLVRAVDQKMPEKVSAQGNPATATPLPTGG
jgi:hypothetical protein